MNAPFHRPSRPSPAPARGHALRRALLCALLLGLPLLTACPQRAPGPSIPPVPSNPPVPQPANPPPAQTLPNPALRWQQTELNTWRTLAKAVTAESTLRFVDDWLNSGLIPSAITIDDGWFTADRVGDWTPDPDAFPNLALTVAQLRQRGLLVRLWIAPVNVHPDLVQRFPPEWFFRMDDGEPYIFGGLGYLALDPRLPAVREHIRQTIRRLVLDYDIDGLKADFGIAEQDHRGRPIPADWAHINNLWLATVREALFELKPQASLQYYVFLPGLAMTETLGTDFFDPQTRTEDAHAAVAASVRTRRLVDGLPGRSDMVWGLGPHQPETPAWISSYTAWLAREINFGNKLEFSFEHHRYPNAEALSRLANRYSAQGPPDQTLRVYFAGQTLFDPDWFQQHGIPLRPANRYFVTAWPEAQIRFPHVALGLANPIVRNHATGQIIPATVHNAELLFNAPAGLLLEILPQ